MIRKRALLATILIACGVVACGKSVERSEPSDADVASVHSAKSGAFSYRFSDAGCDTGRHRFATLADYCAGLRSHRLNHGCALDQRKKEFEQDCPGAFDESDRPHPIGLHPTPTPTPTPAPTPTPTPVPQVIADLSAAGMVVDVVSVDQAPDPDGPIFGTTSKGFESRFQAFLPTLTKEKNLLIGRRSSIKKITITGDANYQSDQQSLSLFVDMTPSELSEYLQLLDRRTAVERQLGFQLDFGKEVTTDEVTDPLEELRSTIVFFENNVNALKGLKGAVRRVKFSDHVRYSMHDRVLYLMGETYQTDALSYATFLAPLAPTLAALAKADIPIALQDFSADRQRDLFSIQILSISTAVDDLADLVKRKQIFQIQMATQAPLSIAPGWGSGSPQQALLLSSVRPDLNAVTIHALVVLDQLQDDLKIPIQGLHVFDERYALAVTALQSCEADLENKLGFISEITIGSTRTVFSSGILSISEWETTATLCPFIRQLPNTRRPGLPSYPFPGVRPYGND